MRALDADDLLAVAHIIDKEVDLAVPCPVGLRLPERKPRARTRCGMDVGMTWVDADRYQVPDCADCDPDSGAREPTLL